MKMSRRFPVLREEHQIHRVSRRLLGRPDRGPPSTGKGPGSRAGAHDAGRARAIDEDVSADHSVTALASRASMSPFHFIRCFNHVVGTTPHTYVRIARLRQAARLLRAGMRNFPRD
jgi:AraC-like DNA-binding protein